MRATIVRPTELDPSDRQRWREFQRRSPTLANPFLGPDVAVALGRQRPGVKVAVLEDGPSVVGYFPFEEGAFGWGRALGMGVLDQQGLVHAPGLEWDGHDLLRRCGLTSWTFDHLVADQVAAFAPGPAELRSSPAIDLHDGWEGWLAAQRRTSRSRIAKALQYERKLARDFGTCEVRFDERDEASLDLLMRWKSMQYRRTGRADRFRRGWLAESVRELFWTRGDGASCQLSTLHLDGRPAALYLALRSDDVMAGWFPVYDPDLGGHSPGLVHLLKLVRLAADDGVQLFDLGAGEADYKSSFANLDLPVGEGVARRPTAGAAARDVLLVPARRVERFVLDRPALRRAARTTLRQVGSVRVRMGDGQASRR